jgi:hypothetical protein
LMVLNLTVLAPYNSTDNNNLNTCLFKILQFVCHGLAGRTTVHIEAMGNDQPTGSLCFLLAAEHLSTTANSGIDTPHNSSALVDG